jgi:hypothetical protein
LLLIFLSVFGKRTLSSLQYKVLKRSAEITEGRGRHSNHKKISEVITEKLKSYCDNLEGRQAHYCVSASPNRKYLESDRTNKKLRDNFLTQNNDETKIDVKSKYFYKYFTTTYYFRIEYP